MATLASRTSCTPLMTPADLISRARFGTAPIIAEFESWHFGNVNTVLDMISQRAMTPESKAD